jgi:hypothetical protein
MNYNDLIQLYFERSNALQAYWTLYVVVVGGLLAVSSMNKYPSFLTTVVVTVLFCLFAYKNLDAIQDTTSTRFATLQLIRQTGASSGENTAIKPVREVLEPTLNPATYSGVTTTHLLSDALTIAAFWTMELRRRKNAERGVSAQVG